MYYLDTFHYKESSIHSSSQLDKSHPNSPNGVDHSIKNKLYKSLVGKVTPDKSTSLSVLPSLRSPPLPTGQLSDRDLVQTPAAGSRALPPAAFPLGHFSLGSGATARPAGKAPPQEAVSQG